MNRVNQILSTKTLYLALIIIAPSCFIYYDTREPELSLLLQIFNQIGFWIYLFWLHAIASKGNKKVRKIGLEIKGTKNISTYILICFLTGIYIDFSEANSYVTYEIGMLELSISNQTPIILAWFGLYLYITYKVANLVVSIERAQNIEFKEVYKTWLLLLFTWIGIVFVHGRVQNNFNINKCSR
jgi:hypothetical protein